MCRFVSFALPFVLLLLTSAVLPGCRSGTPAPNKDDFRIMDGRLYRNDDTLHTIRAFETPGLGGHLTELDRIVPALCRVANVGGNSICFALEGFNGDASTLDPGRVQALLDLAKRCKDQHMRLILKVLGSVGDDPAQCERATRTAATALNDGRILYWFTGPRGPAMAALFKSLRPNLVTLAEQGGDLAVTEDPASAKKDPLRVLLGDFTAADGEQAHFILPDDPALYAKLDKARRRPVELKPWVPDKSVLSEAERKEGFIALFNGRDLSGWGFQHGETEGSYAARDGMLVCDGSGGPPLYTRDRYDNFVLRFEFRIVEGGNSGMFIRAPRDCRQSKIGFEFQILGDYGEEPSKTSTGSVYDQVAPRINAGKPAGEWNTVELTLIGPRYKAILNGELIQDVNFDDVPELRYRLRKGFIAVQDHNHEVAFRNLRIKKL